jgi:hypothetical protein
MSNVSFSIVSPPIGEGTELLSFAFVAPFPDEAGVVFGAFRIPTNAGHIAGVIREHLERWAKRPAPKPELLEAAFEQLVSTINEECRDTIEGEATPIEPRALDIVIGATSHGQLVMTSIGEFRGTFLRQEKEDTFHVYDLLRGLRSEVVGADKLFGSLVAGEVDVDDTVALALPETIQELGEAVWKQTLATMEPGEARAYVLRSVEVSPESGPVLMLRITKERVRVPSHENNETTEDSSVASIEALRQTERTTSALLRGRGLPSSKSAKQILLRGGSLVISVVRWTGNQVRGISIRSALRAPKKVVRALPALARAPRHLFRSRGSAHRKSWRELPAAGARIRDHLLERFNHLSHTAKLLFVLFIVIVVLFIQSILYLHYRKNVVAERDVYNAAISDIRQFQDDADASIIYRDEEGARALLILARDATDGLPQTTRAQRRTHEELTTEIENALVTLRHEILVLPEAFSVEGGSASGGDAWLTRYDEGTDTNPIVSITSAEGRTIGLYQDGALGIGNETFAPLFLNLPAEPVTDAELFGDRLYVFVNSASQVYRLRQQGDGFGSASPWITEDTAGLDNVRSIAIDGAIYLLQPNQLLKFFTGVRETEWQPHIDPPLEDAAKIWTSDEVDGVYILEPSKRRIVVLDKPGGLVAQYVFPEGSDLRDFAVNEAENTLSVLDGTSVKHATLEHRRNP